MNAAPPDDDRRVAEHEHAGEALRQRAHDWEAAQDPLAAIGDLSEYLAKISHDLRTPLSSIMGFTQRLIKKIGDTLPDQERDALHTIDRNAKVLLAVINSVFDFSKVEAAKWELRPARLEPSGVAHDAAGPARPRADAERVEPRFEQTDPHLMIDDDLIMLKQMILRDGASDPNSEVSTNSSSNSRPTPGPEIRGPRILCVDDDPDSLKFLRLTLEDAGYDVLVAADHDAAITGAKAGRPDLICLDLHMPGKDGYEVLKTLRADPDLSFVPVIVVSGSSEDARTLGCGAHRYLSKPVDAHELTTTVRDVLVGEIGSALVIEDCVDSSRLLSQALTERGLNVRPAFNGRQGLHRLAESTPSVIVLDLMMPVMDGFTFVDHLRGDPAWSRIPVIILSAKNLTLDEIDRLGQSCSAVLTKGRDGVEIVIDAILKAIIPSRRAANPATP